MLTPARAKLGILLAAGAVAIVTVVGTRGSAPAHLYLVTAGSVRKGLALEILDRNGHVVRTVARGLAWGKWSPDGSMIAWVGRAGLSAERADGSGRRLLVPVACAKGCTVATFAWSPDGRSLAVGGSGKRANGLVAVAVGSGRRHLVAPNRRDTDYSVLGWTSDSRSIVYMRLTGIAGFDCCERDIRIVAADGSRRHVLHHDPYQQGSSPSLSPDGRSVAALYAKGRAYVVRVLDLRTGREHVIAAVDRFFARSSWSPDSRTLALAGTNGEAITMAAGGGDIQQLGEAGLVAWTRAGDLLIVRGATRDTLAQVWKSGGGRPARFLFRLPEGTGLVTIEER